MLRHLLLAGLLAHCLRNPVNKRRRRRVNKNPAMSGIPIARRCLRSANVANSHGGSPMSIQKMLLAQCSALALGAMFGGEANADGTAVISAKFNCGTASVDGDVVAG